MAKWNTKQRQLVAESLINLALGILLIGIVTPLFSEIKDVNIFIGKSLIILIVISVFYFVSFKMLKK